MGKAEKRGGIVDYLKTMDSQTQENYGLTRAQQAGAPTPRSYSIGEGSPRPPIEQHGLSIFGGVMLGALGYNKIGTEQLTSSGIVDTGDYNASRLTINNNSAFTLKVLLPIYKAGQQVWISALVGQSWTIQNTSGNGDETTGNIEMLQGADYSMSGNDWICFQYDAADEKFHQVSAGINDVGSGSGGETFTWTNHHSAAGYILKNASAVWINASGTNDAFISGSTSGLDYNVASLDSHRFAINSSQVADIDVNDLTLIGIDLTFTGSSGIQSADYLNMSSGGDIDMNTGDINDCGHIQQNANSRHYFGSGGNYIMQNSSNGNLEYRTNSTTVDHSFFVGSLRLNINKDTIEMRNPLDMSANKIIDVTYIQSDTSVGFTENFINMGSFGNGIDITSPTDVTLSGNGSILTLTSSGIDFAAKARPFLSALNVDLGDSTHEWNDLYIQGDVNFSTGGTVDFHDIDSSAKSNGGAAALPANPTSYFKVKYQGLTRYIPYYTA